MTKPCLSTSRHDCHGHGAEGKRIGRLHDKESSVNINGGPQIITCGEGADFLICLGDNHIQEQKNFRQYISMAQMCCCADDDDGGMN
jgi:hypothetical protein